MKVFNSSKGAVIRHESELARHFHEFLRDDTELHWKVEPVMRSHADGGRFDRLEIEFDGTNFEFLPFYELRPSLKWLQSLAMRDTPLRPLVIAPELSTRSVTACKELGLSAIDLNGRTWLRAPGLLVDRRPFPGRAFSYELEPRNIFAGKSARIVRCLLTDVDRIWTQSEIIPRTKVSSGLVSRIVQHLINQGFAEKTSAREFRLRDWDGLIEDWVRTDRFAKRSHTASYAGFFGPPQALAALLEKWAESEKVPLAFTQWSAAWARHPYTEPVVCSAYVARLPEAATLEKLGLRPVTEGGKVWLHIPDDEGILFETQRRGCLTLVTDAQIYLDLQRTGLRGPEAAMALRKWEGFCKL